MTMETGPSFNLVDEGWIPVIFSGNRQEKVGLAGLFAKAGQILDLAVLPHQRVAVMRLLLCLCYAANPDREDDLDWENLGTGVQAYLQEWKEHFWLYHPRFPFLQPVNLQKAKQKDKTQDKKGTPFSKLDFRLASGNNKMLFDHVGEERILGPDQLALGILTHQCFSFVGTVGELLWNGKSTRNASQTKGSPSSKCAPCVASAMLHAFIRGKNLLETLQLNFVPVCDLELDPEIQTLGRPIWEEFPLDKDDTGAVKNATETWLGRLVPLSRAILLGDDSILRGEALRYASLEAGFREPTATVKLNRDNKEAYLSCDIKKAVWRELPAILASIPGSTHSRRGPLAFEKLKGVNAANWEYDLVAVGIHCETNREKIHAIVESVYPLRKSLLTETGKNRYQQGVDQADSMAKRLANAIYVYRKMLDLLSSKEKEKKRKKIEEIPLPERAALLYWTHIEQNLENLFALADSSTEELDKRFDVWNSFIYRTASDVYAIICKGHSTRSLRAFVLGELCLNGKRSESSARKA